METRLSYENLCEELVVVVTFEGRRAGEVEESYTRRLDSHDVDNHPKAPVVYGLVIAFPAKDFGHDVAGSAADSRKLGVRHDDGQAEVSDLEDRGRELRE